MAQGTARVGKRVAHSLEKSEEDSEQMSPHLNPGSLSGKKVTGEGGVLGREQRRQGKASERTW